MTGPYLFLHFLVILVYVDWHAERALCVWLGMGMRGREEGGGGGFCLHYVYVGAPLCRRSIQMCVQAFCFLSGSAAPWKQSPSGRQAGTAVGLLNVGSGLQGGEHSALLNHSTNACIHLQNSAINFSAGVRTFGEI